MENLQGEQLDEKLEQKVEEKVEQHSEEKLEEHLEENEQLEKELRKQLKQTLAENLEYIGEALMREDWDKSIRVQLEGEALMRKDWDKSIGAQLEREVLTREDSNKSIGEQELERHLEENEELEIDEQFHLSKVNINDEKEMEMESEESLKIKENVSLYRMFLLNVLVYTCLYFFWKEYHRDLPFSFSKENYYNECCSYLYNTTKCSIKDTCSIILKVKNSSIIGKCCFWLGSYINPIYKVYCEQSCLFD